MVSRSIFMIRRKVPRSKTTKLIFVDKIVKHKGAMLEVHAHESFYSIGLAIVPNIVSTEEEGRYF